MELASREQKTVAQRSEISLSKALEQVELLTTIKAEFESRAIVSQRKGDWFPVPVSHGNIVPVTHGISDPLPRCKVVQFQFTMEFPFIFLWNMQFFCRRRICSPAAPLPDKSLT
jgi:hypothetical protein